MDTEKIDLGILREKLERARRIDALAAELAGRLDRQRASASETAAALEKSRTSLGRMEKGVVKAFYTLLNKRDERTEKLRQETARYEAEARQTGLQISELERELTKLGEERAELGDAEAAYHAAFGARAEAIMAAGGPAADRLAQLRRDMDEQNGVIAETEEALEIGRQVLAKIVRIEDHLEGAETWGAYDLMGGGGISGLAKHSQLDDAQTEANELRPLLERYRSELADVSIDGDIQVQIEGMLKFADFFLDGFFADASVLKKIHQSQEKIAATKEKVELVQRRLDSSRREAQSRLEELDRQESELIINA